MRVIRYKGGSDVREMSEDDLKNAFGSSPAGGIRIVKAEDPTVTVSNKLAEALVATGEFVIMAHGPDGEEDLADAAVASADAAADGAALGAPEGQQGEQVADTTLAQPADAQASVSDGKGKTK